jgi:hypothetical protein
MRIVASACLVFAILFMVGCGTSAEDKKAIQDQGTKITALDKRIDAIEKMGPDMQKKVQTIWDYLAANPIGKAKFPPAEVKPPVPAAPGAKKEEPKTPAAPTAPGAKKEGAKEPGTKK